jgi:hypothetical protein
MVVRRIKPMSLGKILGVLYAVIGLIIGVLIAIVSAVGSTMASGASTHSGPNPFAMMAGMGIAAIVVIPLMYGIFGFIGGLIMAGLYNLFAGMVGGVEIEAA